jgi:uncharacterized protein (TIGR03382 family)
MQNAYQGPLEAFALVIPVPQVLQEADVKTLPREVFAKVDGMGAPRLVEYWEQDPCASERRHPMAMRSRGAGAPAPEGRAKQASADYGVTIEAQFEVGEYQIVILSARDSTGLDGWLRVSGYQIPAGAEPLLRPYVEGGMKFFVAKVDPSKVTFDHDGRAQLSPLRFHYDHDEFVLPIRLGLANSSGKQDLIVNILSPEGRFEVANYPNATIPTNLDVRDDVRGRFGEFYAALFDRTVERHPGAVVTEYAWDASTCDPCPGPNLDGRDFATLGADVLGGGAAVASRGRRPGGGMVLTRLHARYGREDVPDDLVFQIAPPIVGGREHVIDAQTGQLEEGAREDRLNNFQGRYAIRHAWTGPIECDNPRRGRWGGPPRGERYAGPVAPAGAELAFAPRGGVQLARMVTRDIPELGIKAAGLAGHGAAARGSYDKKGARAEDARQGCGCTAGGAAGSVLLALLALSCLRRRRRTRCR